MFFALCFLVMFLRINVNLKVILRVMPWINNILGKFHIDEQFDICVETSLNLGFDCSSSWLRYWLYICVCSTDTGWQRCGMRRAFARGLATCSDLLFNCLLCSVQQGSFSPCSSIEFSVCQVTISPWLGHHWWLLAAFAHLLQNLFP